MLNGTSNMPEYQWKLTIVERNLLLSNWMKLIPEAQEQMLWETAELMGDLPLLDKQRLLAAIETLQHHVEGNLQQKLQQIFSNYANLDVRKPLELNIPNTPLSAAA